MISHDFRKWLSTISENDFQDNPERAYDFQDNSENLERADDFQDNLERADDNEGRHKQTRTDLKSKMNRMEQTQKPFICGCLLQLPFFIPNCFLSIFLLWLFVRGVESFGVARESFGFPFLV